MFGKETIILRLLLKNRQNDLQTHTQTHKQTLKIQNNHFGSKHDAINQMANNNNNCLEPIFSFPK